MDIDFTNPDWTAGCTSRPFADSDGFQTFYRSQLANLFQTPYQPLCLSACSGLSSTPPVDFNDRLFRATSTLCRNGKITMVIIFKYIRPWAALDIARR